LIEIIRTQWSVVMDRENENKYIKFIKWIWSKRDVDLLFRTTTLTESNVKDDPSLPTPPLTNIEATELFDFLQRNGLTTEEPEVGKRVYRINKIEEYKWTKLIAELKLPKWKRTEWYKNMKTVIIATITAVIVTIATSTINNATLDDKPDSEPNNNPKNVEASPNKPK